jgi:hypothetical protein
MKRARAAATGAALLVPALLLGAGDAAGERTAVSPAQTVKSADGGLTVSVPRGALAKPARVRIRVLKRAQYPPEVRNARFRPGTKVYALEPGGTRFLKPVTVTRRLDTKLAGFEQGAVPGVTLATRDAKGTWELLKSMKARLTGRTLVVSGTTRHFSSLLALDEGFSLSITPKAVDAEVGDTWEARVVDVIDNSRRSDTISVDSDETRWGSTGVVGRGENITYLRQQFTCKAVGTGTYSALVTIAESSLAVFLGGLGNRYEEKMTVTGNARCRAKAPTTRLELVTACVAVVHSPFAGGFPSYLRWLLQFAGAPPNARAELTVGGMNNQQPVVGTIGSNGRVELRGGISSYGPKQVQRIGVAGVDVTSQLVAQTGAAPVVTSEEKVIAGTCP